MHLFDSELVVSQITVALFVPAGSGTPVHKNRGSHGFAFSVGCEAVYRFAGGPELRCGPGDCIYLPQGSNYTVKLPEKNALAETGIHAMNFLLLGEKNEFAPFVLHVRGRDGALAAFKNAETFWRDRSIGYEEACFMELYRLIFLLKKEAAKDAPSKALMDKLAPAIRYLEENYTEEDIRISHLAALCSVSEEYLRRLFRAAFSEPPSVYVRNLRLRRAEDLLRSGECSVSQVAILSGFNDVSYFSREFKKATGFSPSRYMAQSLRPNP